MTDPKLLSGIRRRLAPIAGEDAPAEARFLCDYLEKHPDRDMEALLDRRLGGEPLQYVLGEWEFYGLPFFTDRRALIPRPDTELLAETGLRLLKGGERVLDLCCGSGCIGIALKKHCHITLVASDISPEALSLTRENAARNGVAVETVQSDLFDRIEGMFDLIVSNPPYLTAEEMTGMDDSLAFEPRLALDGGIDGLDLYRRIAADYRKHLVPGGTLLLEIGYLQAEEVTALFDRAECRKDYGGRDRMVIVRNE